MQTMKRLEKKICPAGNYLTPIAFRKTTGLFGMNAPGGSPEFKHKVLSELALHCLHLMDTAAQCSP